jgi:dTDP-4-amino-4,6-dideoxygalactose transaminase
MDDGAELTDATETGNMAAEGVDFTDVYVDEEIVDSVAETMRSGRYVKGPTVEEFEARFAELCGTEHAVGVGSGTDAIYLALKASGIGPGDDVFVPAHTFFATASPVLALGANPVFVDIDLTTYTMGPIDLQEKVSAAENPEAVVPVHIYGHPAEMHAIPNVATEHDLTLVEDACQAHGATYRGETVGSFGDAGCFSFYPSKNMTVAGDGGMLVTDDDELAREARMLRNHGRDDDGVHRRIGLNRRMSEVAATVGLDQLDHLPTWNEQRRAAARRYTDRLSEVPQVKTPNERRDVEHAYHLYVINVPDREELRAYLDERGIDTGIHYDPPVHHTPAVRDRLDEIPTLGRTEWLTERILSLPMHPRITEAEIDAVCDAIEEYYEA